MINFRYLLAGFCLALCFAGPANPGDLYKWVDDQGKVHYGDSPPDNARLKRINGNISSFTSVSVEPFKFDPDTITRPRSSPSVVLYSTSWCGYCRQAVSYFRRQGIAFTEYDIEKSAKGARDYKTLNGRGVPIILIGDQRMNGFNAQAFDRLYYGKS